MWSQARKLSQLIEETVILTLLLTLLCIDCCMIERAVDDKQYIIAKHAIIYLDVG